jgi:hypothetical protein
MNELRGRKLKDRSSPSRGVAALLTWYNTNDKNRDPLRHGSGDTSRSSIRSDAKQLTSSEKRHPSAPSFDPQP